MCSSTLLSYKWANRKQDNKHVAVEELTQNHRQTMSQTSCEGPTKEKDEASITSERIRGNFGELQLVISPIYLDFPRGQEGNVSLQCLIFDRTWSALGGPVKVPLFGTRLRR